MPAFPEQSSDHASPASNTDPTSKQSSAVSSASYPPHPSRNVKTRDSLDTEPVDEGEKEIWRNVRQEFQQMLDDAREHLEKKIKADPDHQAALRKEHEEIVVNCRRMAQEHYLEVLAHEREERSWLSGQNPSPSLVKQQHGIMNRIQSSTSGVTNSNASASTSNAPSSAVHIHNGDTRTKSSSSPPPDASESRDSRSSMSRPLPSFTQQPYYIPPLPPQLAAARRTSHGSAGANNRDEGLGDAAGHDTHWTRHTAFDDELRRPPSTSTSSLRSKASFNEFPPAPGPNGTSPTKPSMFEHPRTSSDRHHATSPPSSKPVDELWTSFLTPEEEAAAAKHYPINRRSSDASMRSISSVASGRHPPTETISTRVDKPKDREFHERKNKDYYSAPNFGSASRSPSSVSPAPGVSSSYPKPRIFDESGMREREYSDSPLPHISEQYPPRPHQSGMDDWAQYPPSAMRKSSRLNDPGSPYEPYQYPSQTSYQEQAVRPTVMRSGSRSYLNHDMHDDPPHRLYPSHSQSIPVPHRSPNPATMASSVDQADSFTGQSPGWRDWKAHQSPMPEDYTGSFKSPSRNSFETRLSSKIIDEPNEQLDHTAWRRRTNEQWLRTEVVSVRESELKRQEEDMKKKESDLISEKTELRMREERIVEREERIYAREQKFNRRFADLEEREKIAREETERLLKVTKSHEEDAKRISEETQKLKEEAQNMKEEARKLMEEAQKSMEEAKTKESEVVKREEVVKNLEASTKELHALVEQNEKSLEAREKELKEKDLTLKKKEEEMKKREEDFKKKVTDAKKKDLSLNHRSDDISNRERTIGNRENEVKRKEEDLANREQDIRSRERDAEMSKYDLEDRASSVVERERDVEMREESLLQAKKEIEAQSEDLKKQWNELQKREHELLNKMKQKLGDEVPKENEMERDREKREEEEKAHEREKREEEEREEQHMKDQMRRMQREREIQEEKKAREEQRRHQEEEERQRVSEEQRVREEVMKGRARRQEEKEKRQWGIGDEERSKEEERKRQQELREAKEKEEKERNRIAKEAERDERFKQEQERMRQQMEHQQREARKRRDSSGPDNFWSSTSASGSSRAPPTRANSTNIPDSRSTPGGPSGWGTSAGSSGWSSSSGTSAGSSGWSSSSGGSAWSSAKATSASSTASSKTQRKPSTNFGAHSSASTSGTEKPKSIEEQNQSTREKFRLEHERQETLRQAKLASAGRSTGDMMQAYIYHENQWETLPKHERLYWDSFPWPMFTLPANAEQITAGAIWAYLKQDVYLAKDKPVSIKDRIKDQIKKWHPDRFETKLLPKVVEDQKEAVKEGAGNVARCLNDLLEKAPSLMGW